ncbi:MAG: hypothetical protein ACHQM6_07365 [Candidatus Kapaibacterium sp.]
MSFENKNRRSKYKNGDFIRPFVFPSAFKPLGTLAGILLSSDSHSAIFFIGRALSDEKKCSTEQ